MPTQDEVTPMAKKRGAPPKPKEIKHARIELSPEDYEALAEHARSIGLGVSSWIRMAVLQRLRSDLAKNTTEP
jgi:hypothetical protein